jgi:hypothetical protein
MKFISASLIVAFLAISATAKGRNCIFRVHAEAHPNDTASFASSVPALFSGKRVAIQRMPRLSEHDVVAFFRIRRATEAAARFFSSMSMAGSHSMRSASNNEGAYFLF